MTTWLVCGPPGAGKTSYVLEHASSGDLIVDLDAIFHAISGRPYYDKSTILLPVAEAVRETLLRHIASGRGNYYNAWVIIGGARASERQGLQHSLGARVVVIETDPLECVARIHKDDRRKQNTEQWRGLVSKWWEKYERLDGDEHVKLARRKE